MRAGLDANTPEARELRFLLLGHPVGQSLSPAMHNAAFRHLGILARYDVLDIPEAGGLPAAIDLLRRRSYAGANVTIPHKVAVSDLVDEVTPRARRVGAVNTVIPGEGGRLTGDNTDGYGLLTAIDEAVGRVRECCPEGRRRLRRVVMFGAGGAARGCLVALADAGAAQITLVARGPERALAMAGTVTLPPGTRVGVLPWPADRSTSGEAVWTAITESDFVLNTTPVTGGETGDPILSGAQFAELLRVNPSCLLGDMVYRPALTAFLRPWAQAGGATVTGLSVLLHQGAESFRLWLDRPAPVAVMAAAIGISDDGAADGRRASNTND